MAVTIHTASGVGSPCSTTSLERLDMEEKAENESEKIEMFDPSAHPNAAQMPAAQASTETKPDAQSSGSARVRTPVRIRPALDLDALLSSPTAATVPSLQTPYSPYASATHARKTSLVPPPPRKTSISSQGGNSSGPASNANSPTTAAIQTVTRSPTSAKVMPARVCAYTPIVASPSLMSPINYTQNTNDAFGPANENPTYNDGNVIPFYTNSTYSPSTRSPQTPSRRGRGILDNDPTIYLEGNDSDEDSVWDTAARWAKAAGKKLSAGEQTIWKMVGVANSNEPQ